MAVPQPCEVERIRKSHSKITFYKRPFLAKSEKGSFAFYIIQLGDARFTDRRQSAPA